MAHDRKKGGARKDHKVERMREDLAWRKSMAKPERPSNDQQDMMDFKPGTASDQSRRQGP